MKTGDWVTGQITLSVNGAPLEMQMTVPAKPVKPQRMLPIFRQIANSFTDLGIKAVEEENQKISCQKGCGACCRQPVPLAEIEAYQIAELVEHLPEPRRSNVKKRFDEAANHFKAIGWFEKLENCKEKEEIEKTVLEYLSEYVACPFLEDECCSIHTERPIGCREYLVTSPAENCSEPTAQTVRLIKLPLKASDGLRPVGRSKNLQKLNFVPFVLALEWVAKYPENFAEKTGEQWMADFFTSLTKSEIPKH